MLDRRRVSSAHIPSSNFLYQGIKNISSFHPRRICLFERQNLSVSWDIVRNQSTRGVMCSFFARVPVYRQNSAPPFDQAIYTNSGSSQQEIRNFRQRWSKKKVRGKLGLEARENYKTTTPTVSTFIMSAPTNVTLFGNHPARRLRFGIYTGLPQSLTPQPCFFPSQRQIPASNPFRLGELLPFAGFSISLAISQSRPVVPALSLECLESQFRI